MIRVSLSKVVCGVYAITHRRSRRVYVGSSWNVAARWEQHHADLARGTHHNYRLQDAYNRDGPRAFTWHVIERTPRALQWDREQYWIDRMRAADPRYGFNIRAIVERPDGTYVRRKWMHRTRPRNTRRHHKTLGADLIRAAWRTLVWG